MNVKIFGERHTATNAVSGFLTKNFETRAYYYQFLGWKHRRAPEKAEWQKVDYQNTLFVITARDPYSWAMAMYREPYSGHFPGINKRSFDDFLGMPFEDYENVIRMWNEKYQSYARLFSEVPNKLIIRMEDFLEDQRSFYTPASFFLKSRGGFRSYDTFVGGHGEREGPVTPDEIVPDLTSAQVAFINDIIAPDLVDFFGYQLRSGQ